MLHNPDAPMPRLRRKTQNQPVVANNQAVVVDDQQPQQPITQFITTDMPNQLINQGNVGQVINIDQSMLQQQQNMIPMSLQVPDNIGVNESALAAHVLQGLEGIQLQLTGNLGQGIQISGLDPNIFSQTVQIDSSLLQHLQNQGNMGNISITINPNLVTNQNPLPAADPNLVQNIQNMQVGLNIGYSGKVKKLVHNILGDMKTIIITKKQRLVDKLSNLC